VWGKLYKRDIIESNQIRFHDIRELGTYEDGLFNLNVFSKAKSVVFIDRHFYHYRRGNNLSITTAYNAKMPEQWDTLFGILLNHIEENELDSSFYVALSNRIVFSLISLGINEIEKHDSTADTVRRINRLIKASHYQNAIAEFDAQYLPFHWRVFFACAKLKFATGVYLLLWVIQRIRGR
jgi:glycosyltransferase EpsH